jgi:hypothetical protein
VQRAVEAAHHVPRRTERPCRDADLEVAVEHDPVPHAEVHADLDVVVHVRVLAVHLLRDLPPGGAADRAVRPEQRPVGQGGAHQGEVRVHVDHAGEQARHGAQLDEAARARHGSDRRIGEVTGEPCDPVRSRLRVGVQPGQHIALGGVEAERRARGDPAPLVHHDPGAERPSHLGAVVGAPVVDDHDLEGSEGLLGEEGEQPLQVAGVVLHGDDDRDATVFHPPSQRDPRGRRDPPTPVAPLAIVSSRSRTPPPDARIEVTTTTPTRNQETT